MSGSPFSLAGRTALVTGANTGLGAAIAIGLASAGADIVALCRKEPVQTVDAVQGHDRCCHWLPASLDGVGPERAQDLLAEAAQLAGAAPAILVNNAGTIRRASALEFGETDWDEVLSVNLKAPFFLAQAFARAWLRQTDTARGERGPAKIIQVASLLSFQGGIRVASYTASKSGIAGLTRLLANEWASQGINVNAIAPGYFATDNTMALRADAQRNRAILERIPAGRWGSPEDLAGAAVFLASSAADYVHGHVLAVDGGWLSR